MPKTPAGAGIITLTKVEVRSPEHQREAAPLHKLIVVVYGLLSFSCVVGGIIAIFLNSKAQTEFHVFGVQLTTGDVGIAFIGIGLVMAYFTIREVLKSQKELASLPREQQPRTPALQQTAEDHLSEPEQEILIASAQEGNLLIFKADAVGSWVRSGKKDFFEKDDPAIQALYLEAFESLCRRGYIRHEGGLLYRLTGRGFGAARQLATNADKAVKKETQGLTPQYSEGDKKAILASWMGSRPSNLNSQVIHFAEIDRELKLEPGTTKKYIKEIAMRWEYVVQHEGEQTILFRKLL